jgi:phosphatidate cytidylyltransferase
MGEIATRITTGLVMAAAVLAAIWLDPEPWSVVAAAALVGCIGYDEVMRMGMPVNAADRGLVMRAIGQLAAAAMVVTPALVGLEAALPAVAVGAVLTLAVAALLRPAAVDRAGQHAAIALAALWYVPLLMALLPLIKQGAAAERGREWLTIALMVAFFSDTFAYFAGRMLGRHKLYPAVSPGKTWEGALGGLLGGVVATAACGSAWLVPELGWRTAVVLGVLGSAAGQVGDLFESLLKRTYRVKDSGDLLPGHGGMLDRVDGLLFVSPVIYAFVTWWPWRGSP